MTPEKLHDAIGLLPTDLVAEADEKRNQLPKRKSSWKPLAAMAACFCLVLAWGLFLSSLGMGGSSKGATMEMAQAAPEAPASQAQPADKYQADSREYEEAAPAEGAPAYASTDPVAGGRPGEPEEAQANSTVTADMAVPAQFAVRLLRSTHTDGQNTLVSPLSVFSALAMTASGADGQTLTQMEDALTMKSEAMSSWLNPYLSDSQLKLANAVWVTDDGRLTIQDTFRSGLEGYRAELYQAPMNRDTCDAINRWVSEKTDGMIPTILDTVPEDAVMYLVNALAFDARWPVPYSDHQVTDATFTTEDGREQEMELMHSTERQYLEDSSATGFIKPYEGGRYGFAVLLPKEGISIADYLATLTGEQLQEMLLSPTATTVYAAIPKFQTAFDAELSDTLKAMDMTDAFDAGLADFSGMGTCRDGSLYISRVKHKTCITVAEQGTQAGAATAIEMAMGAALKQDTKTVTLDRPFVYMIVDLERGFPIFLGTMMDMDA